MSDWTGIVGVVGAVAGFAAAFGGQWLKSHGDRAAAKAERRHELDDRHAEAQRATLLRLQVLLDDLAGSAIEAERVDFSSADLQQDLIRHRDRLLYELAGLRGRVDDASVRQRLVDFQDAVTAFRDDRKSLDELVGRSKELRSSALAATASIGDVLRQIDTPKKADGSG